MCKHILNFIELGIIEKFFLSTATNFSKIIAELETTQQTLTLSIGNNKALLQGVQEAFAVNLENVNKEVTKLEERMKKVVDKK